MSDDAAPFDFGPFESMIYNSRLIFACAFSIIVWEQILSFKDEYNTVWRSGNRLSVAKVIFVSNRYFAIIGLALYLIWFHHVSDEVCSRAHWLPYAVCLTSLMAGDLILSMRVIALWGKNIFVALGLASLLIAQMVYALYAVSQNTALISPEGTCMSIIGQDLQNLEAFNNICCLLFELAALILILIRVYKYRRTGASGGLIDRIFIDSAQYFAIVFCAKVMMNMNLWLNKKAPAIFMPLTIALASIVCSRVFFGLINESQAPSSFNSSTSWRQKIAGSGNSVQQHSVKLQDEKGKEEMELQDVMQQSDTNLDVERGNHREGRQ
ncbi:hypothetical protein P389DRAFT_198923 [Cystobasidium minutum MCA 4210]|uniref:uncharacterized protein n=1 Tax=Cystobasidium minutum MCA 4210 TaxID=1397322 RepID=UPI0034CD07A0|eukprot:jgi/Rhomi1/198923/gm1.7137_g